MSRTTTQQDINDVVWKACDTLRGTIDPAQYKDYILVMLFLKYVSDLVADLRDKYMQEYGGDKTRVDRAMSRERFVLAGGCDFATLYAHRNDPDIGDRLNKVLAQIEDDNTAKLAGVFRNIDFNSEANLGFTKTRNAKLKHLLEDFNDERLDLRPSHLKSQDVLGDAYEYLVARFAGAAKKSGGEFYTPSQVARLLARILKVKAGDRVSDPCCGSGSLLIRACQQVEPGRDGQRNVMPFGQEVNGATWALCKMNMFLHGLDRARIERGDTIRSPELTDEHGLMRFNAVVANPPFSLDKWGHDGAGTDRYGRFHRGVPPRSRGDWAFISHMIESLDKVDGRLGVVVPHGVLFRGASEKLIRTAVLKENLIDGIIGLPANLFYGVGIPAALLFLRHGRRPDEGVFFIDASRDFEKGKNQNVLRDEDLDRIAEAWERRRDVPRYAHLATMEEIAGNDFNLNVSLYVDTFEEEAAVDLAALKKEIAGLDARLAETRDELDNALRELGL